MMEQLIPQIWPENSLLARVKKLGERSKPGVDFSIPKQLLASSACLLFFNPIIQSAWSQATTAEHSRFNT